MDLTENKRAVDAFTYGAGTSGYPPQELLAALLTLDGASHTSGEVEELRRSCEQLTRIPADEYMAYKELCNRADDVWH